MLDDPSGLMWKDTEMSKRLEDRLRESYHAYQSTITDIEKIMKKIALKLDLDRAKEVGIPQHLQHPYMSRLAKFRGSTTAPQGCKEHARGNASIITTDTIAAVPKRSRSYASRESSERRQVRIQEKSTLWYGQEDNQRLIRRTRRV